MKSSLPTSTDVRRIYFKQQRKKNILPEHAVLTANLNDEVRSLRIRLERSTSTTERTDIERTLERVLDDKKHIEEEYFKNLAERLTDYILDQPNQIRLQRGNSRDRETTTLNKRRPTVTLFDRYVAEVLAKSFSVRNHGRDFMIKNVLNALRMTTGAAKAQRSIVRIDIEKFFEFVDHDILRSKISRNSGVPSFALKHVNNVLNAYQRLYNRSRGLPQGVPSSSILSDIYLEPLDERIKQHPNTVLYLRYVDDIFVIADGNNAHTLTQFIDTILRDLKLRRNEDKTNLLTHPSVQKTSVSYLGYELGFRANTSQLQQVDISMAKRDRYLTAVKRLSIYAKNRICWNDVKDVDLFLASCEYLLVPHSSTGDRDSTRIVSGLAYSARYILEVDNDTPNLDAVVQAFDRSIRAIIGKVANKKKSVHLCPCCSMAVVRLKELQAAMSNHYSSKKILSMPARPHLDDSLREKSRNLLWKF